MSVYPYYRQSVNVRAYSSTPVVRVTLNDKGKEQEEIVCICQGKKLMADMMAMSIVHMLNEAQKNTAPYIPISRAVN